MSDIGYGIPPVPQDISVLGQYSEREIRRLRHDLYNAKNEDMTFWGTVEFDNTTQAIVANSVEFSNVIIDGSCDISQRLHCWSGVQIDGTSTFGNKIRFDEFSGEIIDTTELNARFVYVQKFMGLGKFCVSSGVDISGIGFVARPDPGDNIQDFSGEDITVLGATANWYDMDLGPTGKNIVPLNTKAVLLRVTAINNNSGEGQQYIRFRQNGLDAARTNLSPVVYAYPDKITSAQQLTIPTDANGKIEVYLSGDLDDSAAFNDNATVMVMGWYL